MVTFTNYKLRPWKKRDSNRQDRADTERRDLYRNAKPEAYKRLTGKPFCKRTLPKWTFLERPI